MTAQAWGVLLVAYLLGSIPTAYIVTRLLRGADIRQLGDGNVGAKNTFHSVGRLAGATVALADVAKGAAAAALARAAPVPEWLVLAAGACAVLGHDFPIFLRFQGGQGMAAMLGVFGVLFPAPTLFALAALGLTLLVTRNWDLSCAVGFVLLVALLWTGGEPLRRLLYVVLMLPTLAARKVMQKAEVRSPKSVVRSP